MPALSLAVPRRLPQCPRARLALTTDHSWFIEPPPRTSKSGAAVRFLGDQFNPPNGHARTIGDVPAPTKLTPQLLNQLIESIRLGTPRATALRAKGIHRETERFWRKRALERPGSIYATWQERLEQAQAEFTVAHVALINGAARLPSTTVTTVTKHEARQQGGEMELVVTDRTVTEVVKPPDPSYSKWLLSHRDLDFQPRQAVEATVEHLPPDLLNRSMAELLRVVKGDEGPSLLRPDESDARALIGANDDPAR